MELCFIACPIGEPNSSERNRSDQLLKYVLAPVLEKTEQVVQCEIALLRQG